MHFLLIPAGAVLGGLVGFVTRPSYLGMQAPLRILLSGHPTDARYRDDLIIHLGLYAGIGAIAGCILFGIVYAIMTRKPTGAA